MRKYVVIYEERRPLVIYDFATAPFWISLYMRKILFSFLSGHRFNTSSQNSLTTYVYLVRMFQRRFYSPAETLINTETVFFNF
jgi:hypothetical protein